MKTKTKPEKGKKYKCSKCGHETDNLSIGSIRIGCPNCGGKGFEQHDKPEYDMIMKHLM